MIWTRLCGRLAVAHLSRRLTGLRFRMASALQDVESAAPAPLPKVTFITPAYNAARTIRAALISALGQRYPGPIELSVYDDSSTDDTAEVVASLLPIDGSQWPGPRSLVFSRAVEAGCDRPQGPAFGRNRAVEASSGQYLCLLDADDCALPQRVEVQLAAALAEPDDAVLIGGGFTRDPPGSTATYTAWANSLPDADLVLQQWRECTIIQPTWFLARAWWDRIGGWDEESPWAEGRPEGRVLDRPPTRIPLHRRSGQAGRSPVFPEDTLFFHRHLHLGGRLRRIPEPVTCYVFSAGSQTWATPRALLLSVRVRLFEERVLSLPAWQSFTIWGAGRDGKAFFNALSPAARARVRVFVDIDPNKIGKHYPQQTGKRRAAPPLQVASRRSEAPGAVAAAVESEPLPAAGGKRLREDAASGTHVGGYASSALAAARPEPGDVAFVCADARPSPPVLAAGPSSSVSQAALDAAAGAQGPNHELAGGPVASRHAAAAAEPARPVPIVHFSAATPPIVCCVALHIDTGADDLRRNVAALGVTQGTDFWYFC